DDPRARSRRGTAHSGCEVGDRTGNSVPALELARGGDGAVLVVVLVGLLFDLRGDVRDPAGEADHVGRHVAVDVRPIPDAAVEVVTPAFDTASRRQGARAAKA